MRDVYEAMGDARLRLLMVDLVNQIPGEQLFVPPQITHEERAELLTFASSLALSESPNEKSAAYEIAARIVETSNGDDRLVPAAAFIMARIGNFPGRQLVVNRFRREDIYLPEHPLLAAEVVTRELGNTVEVAGRPTTLTDFQMDFLATVEASDSASISAPTSAGKSFVLSLAIQKMIAANNSLNIAYIVPTRALLGQVTRKILNDMKLSGIEVPVRCVPLPFDSDTTTGCVYVLTQERLISLLHSFENKQIIDVLIVDESQSVGDGSRGVLLQTAIERVKNINPYSKIFFASPLTSNPGMLMDYFGNGRSRHILKEKHSPVLQNIILVREVAHKIFQAKFSVLSDFEEHELGISRIGFRFRGKLAGQMACFAKSITAKDESTLIYCNCPKQTEETADELCKLLDDIDDQDLSEFTDFLQKHVHGDYPLVKTILKGVAFHYGSMPNIVRSRIEQLASAGKLKYICCTSTLLQGVNLPAKHIIIDRPRKGRSNPMGRADFLNLAGRAGRLLKEFQGNVWCLHPEMWHKPDDVLSPCYNGADTQDIKISFIEAMKDGGILVSKVLNGEPVGDKQQFDLGIASLGKVFGDFVLPKVELSESYLGTPDNADQLDILQRKCEKIEITVPREIIHSNPSVHPIRLQKLYCHIKMHENIDHYFPLHPHQKGSYSSLSKIFHRLSIFLEEEKDERYTFDAWLASMWIHDNSLKFIIDERINYLRSKNRENEPRDIIFELLEALQQRIRFRYVKNVRVYRQILAHLLVERGRENEVNDLIPIDIFLECGSSSPIVLSLIGIGLTRTTALMLKGKIKFPEDTTPESCLGVLADSNIDNLDIPAICRKEVFELLGFVK